MKLPRLPKIGRSMVCILLLAAFFLWYELRLVEWQIVKGDEFKEIALSDNTDSLEIPAARGEILDKNGVVIAGNRTSYNLVYDALSMVYSQRNATIVKVVSLLEARGEKWRDILPIRLSEEGEYVFREDREEEIKTLKEDLNLAEYATAQDCMTALIKEYDCSGYSNEDTRIVASVRYSMTKDGYSRTNPYVIARDVSAETIGVFGERAAEFPGIEARVEVERYYGEEGDLAPHVVGNVGSLSAEQYDAAVERGDAYDRTENLSGYKWTDAMGQSGLESVFESQLRGKRGKKSVLTDETGAVRSVTVTQAPEEGNSVHLTLDADLQRTANLSLEENIKANTRAKDCTAGAAVVLDVKTFGVLACSVYPDFDMNLYATDDSYVKRVLNDKEEPLYNRALEGTYTPGSVFKPMVALAALQEGVINASSTPYNCDGMFRYYDLSLRCTDHHGFADIYSALAGSCNAFFCDVGLDLTIRRMDAYAQYFALGTQTGVELYEETGMMSNPQEYQESHAGVAWTDGLTAQTAIGQCDNTFTPIQLATYCATIANGGVRLRTHFLDRITDYTGEETVEVYRPEILSDAGLSSDVLGVVREGMRQVAASPDGTAYTTFGDYPYGVAAKTGTAETAENEEKEPNLTFIAYAPIEDPQIAVAVVLEEGYKGAYAQQVAKDIFDQYFGLVTRDAQGNRYNSGGDQIDSQGKVIKTKEELDAEASPSPSVGSSSSGSSSPESSDFPKPTPSPSGGRDDGIPDLPYTGESSAAPDASLPPETSSSPQSDAFPNSPYWSGP